LPESRKIFAGGNASLQTGIVRALACCLVVFTFNQLMLTEELEDLTALRDKLLEKRSSSEGEEGGGDDVRVSDWLAAQQEAREVEAGGAGGEKGDQVAEEQGNREEVEAVGASGQKGQQQ
jgi:hypothetical protein